MKKQYFDARTYGLRKNAACKTLARVLDVPFAVADATTLTEAVTWVKTSRIYCLNLFKPPITI